MSSLSSYYYKFFLKQWNVGIVKSSLSEIINDGKIKGNVQWLPLKNDFHFLADPFILNVDEENGISILAEEFHSSENKGKISLISLSFSGKISSKVVYEMNSHLSYPCIFREDSKIFVIPESSKAGRVDLLEWDNTKSCLNQRKTLIHLPLLDTTLVNHEGRYYLFGLLKTSSEAEFIIYHSNNLNEEFVPHPASGRKSNGTIERSAGNFFRIGNDLYRPSQRSIDHYGQSIIINKVTKLDEWHFEEEYLKDISPIGLNRYDFGMHTINEHNGYVVIDGLTKNFKPFYKLSRFFQKNFGNRMDKSVEKKIDWMKSSPVEPKEFS